MSAENNFLRVTLEFDPEEMSRRGRIGAHVLHSRYDSRKLAANAREGFLSKLERDIDPDGLLSPEERRRRAEHARKAHMVRIARLSAIARRKQKDAGEVSHAAA